MFIGRKADNNIYGLWTVKQWDGQEELADDHLDVITFNTPNQRVIIQAQIDTLERTQLMPRVTREALLGIAVQQYTALGMTDVQAYAANIGYRKLKDFEVSIVALRNQMAAIV